MVSQILWRQEWLLFPRIEKKNILTYAVIQILKIVLVDVKEMAYSPDTVFIALGSTPELKTKTKKTAKQLICISTLRNKLI